MNHNSLLREEGGVRRGGAKEREEKMDKSAYFGAY